LLSMDIGANPLLLLISLGQAIKLHLINEPTILEPYINAMCFFVSHIVVKMK
jgi:hypothetical protein